MRVYEITGQVAYGGGLAVVAANNRQQAHKVLAKEDTSWDSPYGFKGYSIQCIKGMTMECKTPRVISNFTYIE